MKTRTIMDIETSTASESALLVFKTKFISEIWDHIRFPRFNELICKNGVCVMYCKHYLLESSYDFSIVINFCKYLIAKYSIVIEKR